MLRKLPDGQSCTGCGACAAICPVDAIFFRLGNDGFMHPVVEDAKCLDCGACAGVCPVLSSADARTPLACFGAVNRNEGILGRSTSGGVFAALCRIVLKRNGVVVGCVWDEDGRSVRHVIAESESDCARMNGSKYVQSECGQVFPEVRKALETGRSVLFTGTPCQVAGLKGYLGRDYPELLTAELVCHGIGSLSLWHRYVSELEVHFKAGAKEFLFRKKCGKGMGGMFVCSFDNGRVLKFPAYSRGYSRAFLKNLCLRSSCFGCPAKHGRSGADLAMGDFWGVEHYFPDIDRDKGVSAVAVYTERGLNAVKTSGLMLLSTTWNAITSYNPSFYMSVKKNKRQCANFQRALRRMSIDKAVVLVLDGALPIRMWTFLKRCVHGGCRRVIRIVSRGKEMLDD